MSDYGLQGCCRDINLAAAQIARKCADEFSTPDHPRFVAGSIGPTSRTTSVATSGEPLSKDLLREAYAEQIQALVDGGVDVLLIETIFDVENARIAIEEAKRIAPQKPIMLSFNVSTVNGQNMLGQNRVVRSKDHLFCWHQLCSRYTSHVTIGTETESVWYPSQSLSQCGYA